MGNVSFEDFMNDYKAYNVDHFSIAAIAFAEAAYKAGASLKAAQQPLQGYGDDLATECRQSNPKPQYLPE